MVALLSSGRPLMVPWLFERAHAVLATWFLGSEAGNAIGDVLSGRWNPTGRLPVSWPVELGQVPIFYAQRPTGRPPDPAVHYSSKYLDLPVEPLFPFGHGLSYAPLWPERPAHQRERAAAGRERSRSSATWSTKARWPARRPCCCSCAIRWRAWRARCSSSRAWRRSRSSRAAATSSRFTLKAEDLAFLGADLTPRLEPGVFELLVGRSAAHAKLLRTSVRLLAP